MHQLNYIAQIGQDVVFIALVFLALIIFLQRDQNHGAITPDRSYEEAWWVTVTTEQPNYEYLFGPFESQGEAEENRDGYLEDLSDEGAQVIQSKIQWCKPDAITRDLRQLSV